MTKYIANEEFLEGIRQRYDEGVPIESIVADTGLARHKIYSLLGRQPPGDGPAPDDPLVDGVRTALLRRLWLNADHQVAEIERRLAAAPPDVPPERETRTLAVLARIVRELSAAEAVSDATRSRRARARAEAARRREADDDGQPRTLEQLREELGRRLEQLRSARSAGGAPGDLPRG